MKLVYVDGQHGTSGIKLRSILGNHPQIKLLEINADNRRDIQARISLMESADLITLCLPQNIVKSTLETIPKGKKVLDCSNEFRCDPEWVYGLPELGSQQRTCIQNSSLVVNPGCFATAFILIVKPLIQMNFINENSLISVSAMNGYSAGGSRMIKLYESAELKGQFHGLNQKHKHLPEMIKYSGLKCSPSFIPAIGNYKEGLILSIPLTGFKREEVLSVYGQIYSKEKFINIIDSQPDKLSSVCESVNYMNIYVTGVENRLVVTAKMSNLFKGAASNAVQNINLMLGLEECLGL